MKPTSAEVKAVNINVIKGERHGCNRSAEGRRRTWAAYDVLQAFHAVPVNNFRPQGNDLPEKLFGSRLRDSCHQVRGLLPLRYHLSQQYPCREARRQKYDGFLAKFDYEPLNLGNQHRHP